MTPWQALDVAPDVAVADLRRRYAALIKEFRPETHPQDFARIREAYEVVLSHARRREAAAAQRAQDGDVAIAADPPVEEAAEEVDAAPPVQTSTAPAVQDEAAAPVEVVASPPVARASPEPDAEPPLAAHFRGFHEQAATARGSDDEAHLPALRALLQARTQATLDDSQALEFALMRWFVEAESPPLTLLFETGRAFDWHRHAVRLSSWLSPWALRQMEARLALSRDLVYARHFSGNAWLRRLHAARSATRLLVMRPAAVEAMFWVERWRRLSEDADAAALADCLNAVAIRQMRGPSGTDLLVGLAVAACAPDLASAAAWGALAAATVFGLRRLLQTIGDLPDAHWARRGARVIVNNKIVVGVLSAVAAWLGALVFTSPEPGAAAVAVAALLIAPLALFAAAWGWRIAAFLELVLAWPFQWREAVDRLEFDRFAGSNAMPAADQPFGTRLGLIRRLQAMRAALKLQAVELTLRERPPRARPFKLLRLARPGGSSPSLWRTLWFGAWVLFALARLVHAFGGGG